MNWRFWQPKHTFENVARQLVEGLRDGSVEFDRSLDDDDFDADAIVMQIDVAQGMTDAAILELVKQCATTADEEDRRNGGIGLRIGRVVVDLPKVKVGLQPRTETKHAGAV
jgi:hypothetical protein